MNNKTTNKVMTALSGLTLAIGLVGCGGGDTTTSTPPPDPTVFTVVSSSPHQQATGVAIQTTISVAFTKDVDLTTLNTSNFTVTGALGSVAGAITYNSAGKSATFTPAAALAKIALYTATVTTAVKDTTGKPLAASYSCAFTTGPIVAAKEDRTLILKSDGTVWSWGLNDYGQLGDGSLTDQSSPTQVIGLSGATIASVAAGGYHSLALKSDGTVLAWGENGDGQLGDGSPSWSRGIGPVPVKNLTGVVALAAGYWHSLALKSDGTVWTWGTNGKGQLGDGTTNAQSVPVQVSGLTGVIAIAAGTDFNLALKSDGTVWGWGADNQGQLGDNNDGSVDTFRKVPVRATGLTGITAISGGYEHGLALKSDGTVWAWGRNDEYECGVAYSGHGERVPVQVTSLSGITGLVAGGWHSLALKSNGTVWGWGSNYYRELGSLNWTDVNYQTPVQTSSLTTGSVAALVAGVNHSLAMKSDGTLFSWGDNGHGELGDGTTALRATPVQVGLF